jgi:hypothetical protein
MQKTICGHDTPDRNKGKGSDTDATTSKPINDTDSSNSGNQSNSTASDDPEVVVHSRKKRSTDDEFEDFDVGKGFVILKLKLNAVGGLTFILVYVCLKILIGINLCSLVD